MIQIMPHWWTNETCHYFVSFYFVSFFLILKPANFANMQNCEKLIFNYQFLKTGREHKQENKTIKNFNHGQNSFLIKSLEAIAAIFGDIVIFYNSKNLNCIGALCFFNTFFNDFDLPKRDKQVKPSGH